MRLFHHVALMHISESEKQAFLDAGVKFTKIAQGPRGEATFDIGDDDPRWERIHALVEALEREFRAVDLATTTSGKEPLRYHKRSNPAKESSDLEWLEGYSGQTVEELLELEGKYRINSIVAAVEQGILLKMKREGNDAISDEERTVLAVEALEREVNGGGYDQFFAGPSCVFASMIVEALRRIGCRKTANITQRALKATGLAELTVEVIENVMATEDGKRQGKLSRCDNSFHETAEPIAERLFAFIKANKSSIRM